MKSIIIAGLAALGLAAPASAQQSFYPAGPYGGIVSTPGRPPVGVYTVPGYGGGTTFVQPGMQQQPAFTNPYGPGGNSVVPGYNGR